MDGVHNGLGVILLVYHFTKTPSCRWNIAYQEKHRKRRPPAPTEEDLVKMDVAIRKLDIAFKATVAPHKKRG